MLKALNKLGLIPRINHIEFTDGNPQKWLIRLQINCPRNKNESAWIVNTDFIKLFRIRYILSFDETKTQSLKNNITLLSKSGFKDCITIDEKLKLDNNPTSIVINNTSYWSDTITKTINVKLTNKINHLSLFVALYLDNDEVAKKFDLPITYKKNSFAISINETLFSNGNIVSNKLLKNNFFNDLNKINLTLNKTNLTKTNTINEFVEKKNIIFQDFFYTKINKDKLGLLFFVNLENLFKTKSLYFSLFSNSKFFKRYFSIEEYKKPTKITITRITDYTEDIILSTKYNSTISTEKCSVEEIESNQNLLCISVSDNKLINTINVSYKISLEFEDNTIKFLQNIFEVLKVNKDKIDKIANFAGSKNYYNLSIDKFDSDFFDLLNQQNLSLENLATEFLTITNLLSNQKLDDLRNINNFFKNNQYNIDSIIKLQNGYSFLLTEISKFINQNKEISSLKIETNYTYDVYLNNDYNIQANFFETNKGTTLQTISKSEFKNRINKEIIKYYTTSDLTINTLNSYLTPASISSREFFVDLSNKQLSSVDYNLYNALIIDTIYSNFDKTLKLSELEKLQSILINNQISIKQDLITSEIEKVISSYITNDKKINLESLLLDNKHLSLIFSLFINSFVFNNNELNLANQLNPNDKNSKISNDLIQNLPIQLKFIYDSYMNEPFTLKSSILDKDIQKAVALFFNCFYLFEIQYLDTSDLIWKKLDNLNINNTLICRLTHYKSNTLNPSENKSLNILNLNDIFLIKD